MGVQSCTQRYNMKSRVGKGFSLVELKAAGVSPRYARTIGVAVDHRRQNHSEESIQKNVQRLKEYLGKLILFPVSGRKASGEQLKNVTQNTSTTVLPLPTTETKEAPRDLTADEKKRQIYMYLRAKSRDEKFIGIRLARVARKAAAEK